MLKFGGSPKFHKTKFPFITRFSNFEGSTLTCHQIHKLRAPELPSYIVVNHIHISEGWVKKQSKCNFLFFFPMGAIWPPPGSPCYLKTSGGIGLIHAKYLPHIFYFIQMCIHCSNFALMSKHIVWAPPTIASTL